VLNTGPNQPANPHWQYH